MCIATDLNQVRQAVAANEPERRTAMFIATIIRKINEWTRYRRNIRELAALTDRELEDIGIHRSDIERLSWESARA